MTNSEIVGIFPTPLYVAKIEPQLTDKEIEFVHREKLYSSRKALSNRTVGTDSFDMLNFPELTRIKEFIQFNLNSYAETVLSIENKLFPTLCWVNRTPPGASHYSHHHTNSLVSGVFYFTPNPTPIEFFTEKTVSHTPLKLIPKKFNQYNTYTNIIHVTQGTLIIFPSYLDHSVSENIQPHDRISLSFNTWIDGAIGNLEESSYLNFNDLTLKNERPGNLDIMDRDRPNKEN
jgi:uncharacterized protein (TIGR02466 family)